MTESVVLAVVAGMAFSAIAWAYRAGAAHGIATCFAAVGMGLAGVLWFGVRSFLGADAPGLEAPPLVWYWGVANGLAQGYIVYLFRIGLQHGPLAPLWCASSLMFVTPAVYAVGLLGERLNGFQIAGMLAAFACVVAASLGQREDNAPRATGLKQKLAYLVMLVVLMVLNGLGGAILKYMAATEWHGAPLNPRFNNCYMLGVYGALLVWVGTAAIRTGRPAAGLGRVTGYATLAGAGSVIGMALTSLVSRLAGGTGFAIIAVSAVLTGSLITSFGFQERRGRAWWATVALAVAAVILFNRGGSSSL